MRVSEKWLRTFVNPAVSGEIIAEQLTQSGLEVDGIIPASGAFTGVVVGHVTDVKPHPDANKLNCCTVDIGSNEPLAIVCGASNVRTGLNVAVATVGAVLPGDFKIKAAKLRGEPSFGMLCSESELGVCDKSEGIWELCADAPVGKNLREYLDLDDLILDIDLTPNRGDCLSMEGIAIEVAVANECELKLMSLTPCKLTSTRRVEAIVQATEACPAYLVRVIEGISTELKSPLWLTERLRRAGLRPKSLLVDVTNYVMLEMGQPMHAFDASKLTGAINVRLAGDNESLTLLDGSSVDLKPGHLLISDESGPIALAGVMGGIETAVSDETTDIVLESAHFSREMVAGVARSYGLSSDSAHRFERGVSPDLQLRAIERASELIIRIAGGKVGPITTLTDDRYLPKEKTIAFEPAFATRLLGMDLSEETMAKALTRLGFAVDRAQSPWQVSVPVRRFDMTMNADCVEEIARIIGYDNIPYIPIVDKLSVPRDSEVTRDVLSLSMELVSRGYHEMISYSFVEPRIQEAVYEVLNPIRLLNPISAELSEMRQGLWPGLLAAAVYNQHRQQSHFKLFETGLCFSKDDKGNTSQAPKFSGLSCGQVGENSWHTEKRALDFYDIKADVLALLPALDFEFKPHKHPALHPGQSAGIWLGKTFCGLLGGLHPALCSALDLEAPVWLFELNLKDALKMPLPEYQGVSKFPSIRRDLAFLMDEGQNVGEIKGVVVEQDKSNWLQAFDVFDIYKGAGIPDGKKSIAFALTLQDIERTLVESEVTSLIDAIIKELRQRFAMTLRE